MRLELKQTQGPAPSGPALRWFFERGRRTLGRSGDCDWQVPDAQCAVSKLHCTIERDREGFRLRDESANGTKVDGVLVLEGETARLLHNSRLEFGGFAFSVIISGEKDRDLEDPEVSLALSDEHLTISAILADVAPGGQTANGILGGRDAEDWPPGPSANRTKRHDNAAPSSRNVEIGWSGPPETNGLQTILPSDWNADSDYGNRLEHGSATHVSVPVARNRVPADGIEPADANAPTVSSEDEDEAVAVTDTGHAPDLMSRLEGLLNRYEEAASDLLAIFEIDAETLVDSPDLFGIDREGALLARLETVLARQVLFNTALEGLVKEASYAMEPRIVEARVDTESRKLPWRSDRTYWQAYRQHFENDGRSLSVREFFRKAMLRTLGMAGEDTAETTERVNRTS